MYNYILYLTSIYYNTVLESMDNITRVMDPDTDSQIFKDTDLDPLCAKIYVKYE